MPILYVIIFIPQKSVKNLALKYSDIIRVKKKERQAMVKGMDIVYIYHDKIDEASHTSNSAVFPACDEAIQEIKNMMHIIVNEMNSTRAFITADHGFIYTYSPFCVGGHIPRASLNSPFQTGKYALDLALEKKVRRIPVDISGNNTNVS